ncbi:MAG: hypothetical protein ACK5AK_04810 [Gemmatimonas sp.]|jgi:hypothetical protein
MELIRESLIHQRLKDQDWFRDQQREHALVAALRMQRDTFQYCTTITFRQAIPLGDAVVLIRKALRQIEHKTGQHLKHFVSLALTQNHQWQDRDIDVSENTDLIAHWHAHAMLSGIPETLSVDHVAGIFWEAGCGHTLLQRYDGHDAALTYLVDASIGNRVGKLQFTNDRTIRTQLARAGQLI